jgi:hypothetical protein
LQSCSAYLSHGDLVTSTEEGLRILQQRLNLLAYDAHELLAELLLLLVGVL